MTISGVRDDLPSDIVISYNGYPLPTNVDIVGFQTKGVPDRAGRTFTGLRHTLSVKFWVNAFDAQDAASTLEGNVSMNIAFLRGTLMKIGAQLILQNTSFGAYTINGAAAGSRDLQWGPIPEDFSWKPYNKYGAEISWRVSWLMNACDNLTPATSFLEWNYGLTFSLDKLGYTTRTYKGTVTIPMTRKAVNDRTLADQADRLREKVIPHDPPVGFRRDSQNFDLSDDKRTLSFTVVDQEMPPNMPPPGVIVAEGSHSMRNQKAKNFYVWQHSLRVKYEISNDRQASQAWEHFSKLYVQRTQAARDNKMFVLPLELHLSEPTLYGSNAAEISLTYAVFPAKKDIPKAAQIRNKNGANYIPNWIVARSGLWTPTGDTWQAWSSSMWHARVSQPRGYAGLAFAANEDAIVDLCGGSVPVPQETSRQLKPTKGKINVKADSGERPDPANSYLDYQLGLQLQVLDNTVVLQPLPTATVGYAPPAAFSHSAVGGYLQPYTQAPNAITQYRGAPRIVVTLWGRAVRAGYDIPPPQLAKLWGQTPLPVNDETCGFRSWVSGNLLVPLVRAEWCFRYVLPAVPSQPLVAPPNPVYGGTLQEAVSNPPLEGFVGL